MQLDDNISLIAATKRLEENTAGVKSRMTILPTDETVLGIESNFLHPLASTELGSKEQCDFLERFKRWLSRFLKAHNLKLKSKSFETSLRKFIRIPENDTLTR